MPPTKEVQQDPKRDHDDKDHDTKDGAQQHTTQPVRSADDIVRNSLERLGGGGQSSDAPALSDAILAPPGGNFKWNAQRLTIEANLAEGKTTVSNMSFTVKDSKGNERQITGPSSYNTHGQQFVIDQATMQRFRVIPPSEDGGSAVLRPVGRRGGGESMTVVEQKNVEPYARGTNGRTVDGGTTAPKTAEATPTKQTGDAPVTPGKPGTGQPTTADGATTVPARQTKGGEVEPVVPNTGTTGTKPEVKPEVKPDVKPEPVVRTTTTDNTGGTAAPVKVPEVSAAQPAISRNPEDWGGGRWKPHGNGDGNGDGDNNRWRNRGDNDPTRADAFRQIREAVYKAEPPLSKDQLQTIREQFRQDPVKALQTVYQIEKQVQETRGGQPDPRQGQPIEQPRTGQQPDPRVGQPLDPRIAQPLDPRIAQPLDPRVGQGQPIDRQINQLDPRQVLAQLANEGKGITPQPQPGDRGSPPQPIDPRTGMPPQIGERPQVQPPVVPGDRGNPVNINPADLGKLVLAAGGQQNPGRPVDQALVEAMKNPQLRPALVEFLQNLQQGKLPGEQQVQQNKQLADVIKMLGPEGLNDIRKAMIEKDAAMKPGGEMKLDAGATNPRLQNILELITSTTNPRNADLINGQSPGALVSERLLAILRENDKGINRVPDADATKANLLELGKLVKDLNTQQGLEAGKALTIRDIIGRSLDDGRTSGLPAGERRDFAVKPQGADDAVVKALLDKLVTTREGERNPDSIVRTETMTARLEPKTIDIKLDGKTEPGVKIDTKLDTTIVKPESAVKAELTGKPETTIKPEDARTARDPAARPDGILQPQVKTDRLPDGDATKADAQQGKLPGDLQNKDKKEDESEQARKLKEKERKQKEEDAQAQQDAALLALMNQKKRKETEDKDKQESTQEKDKKEPERRQKYIVKPGDTLESIAERQLRDKRLAGLIFEINSTTIPVELINGKKTPKLQERMVIWLPTPTETKEYRGRLMASSGAKQEFSNAEDELVARFGKNWDGGTGGASGTTGGAGLDDMEEAAKTAYQARRKHIESLLGPLSSRPEGSQAKHVVRLGETLKSVAMKHPALQDVTLWKLLAELNGLPTKTDDRGAPVARLTRGQALVLPTAAEVEAFRQRESGIRPAEKTSAGFELPTRACPSCQRVTFASASLCPACGARFDTTDDAPTARVTAPARAKTSPETTHQSDLKNPPPSDEADVYEIAREFSETARLMHCGSADKIESGYKLRLEVLDGAEWTPLVAYEVFTALCLRHEYQPGQPRKTIRIDLPPQAATELAENDMLTNWASYETKHRRSKTSV